MAFGQPNYGYPQYGYQNQFQPYQYGQQPIVQQPQIQNQVVQPPTQQTVQQNNLQTSSLYGKIVDCLETAKSQDVPIGMSGIYPKADGSAVFIKQWCHDGTTKTNEYKLVEENFEEPSKVPDINLEEKLDDIYNCIDSLSKKLDKMKTSTTPTRKKKVVEEVDEDE